jgi:predicted alpha/beta hydrolase family esterase
MKKALLIHGWATKDEFMDPKYPTASNSHWFPWLSKQLMIRGIHAVAIEMPNSYYPNYEIWKKELERFELDEDTILVGHSCGGGFLVRYLSENDVRVKKVVLSAPWLNMRGESELFDKSFFEFTIDPKISAKTVDGITMVESDDDELTEKDRGLLKSHVDDMKIITLHGKKHFTLKGLGTVEFPELLDEIMKGVRE